MKPTTELVTEIDNLIKELRINLDNPESISKIILELSVKNVGLGNLLVEALDLERQAETQYKYELDNRKLEIMANEIDDKGKKVSATFAESKAKTELKNLLDEQNTCQGYIDILKIKRSDLDKVVDTGRSRLSLIKNDERRS